MQPYLCQSPECRNYASFYNATCKLFLCKGCTWDYEVAGDEVFQIEDDFRSCESRGRVICSICPWKSPATKHSTNITKYRKAHTEMTTHDEFRVDWYMPA